MRSRSVHVHERRRAKRDWLTVWLEAFCFRLKHGDSKNQPPWGPLPSLSLKLDGDARAWTGLDALGGGLDADCACDGDGDGDGWSLISLTSASPHFLEAAQGGGLGEERMAGEGGSAL